MPRPHRAREPRTGVVTSNKPEAVRIRLLGGFWVSVGQRSIGEDEWRLKKAASLIKLLALEPGHRMHRERLMDLLWPEVDAKAAANDLHHALHTARRILEPDLASASRYLRFQGDLLALCPDAPLWVDIESFEDAARAARRVRDPAAHRAAIELYTGEVLPQDLYERWADERREELRLTHQALLVELARLYEEREEFVPAIEALRRVVAAESSHEEAHVGLMRLYALSGRSEEALKQHERLREALSRELGIEPSMTSRRLYAEISAGRFPPADPIPRDRPATEPPGDRRHNLPISRTSFVGREREMLEVRRLLAMTGLLTLTGTGGCGKTRLALEVARDLVGAYPDGVWLVELGPLSEEALVPQAVARALGVREQPGWPITSTLVEASKSKEMLLVLDNCEHLVEACAHLVETLLLSCPNLRILATSREALNIPEETTWLVPSLSLPDPRRQPTVGELETYGSARLFVERARRRRTDFVPSPRNAGAVADVCRRLDGMPLAIELAAARVGVLSVEQISERLGNSLKLLTAGGRTTVPRHQTLHGTLDWSYELLDEPERELFGRLSVFTGGWTLEAAEAVGAGGGIEREEVSALLFRLVDKSLVMAETSEDNGVRYRLLEPVRQYGSEKLDESGEAPETRRRHASFFLSFAEQAEPRLTGAQQATWLERLEIEYGNLRAALGWSLEENRDPEAGLRLAGALWRFCYTRGHYGEGREWLEGTLARTESSPANLRAKALTGAGVLAFLQCEYERATVLLEESLTLYRDLGDRLGIASALQSLGSIARERGRYARAVAFHEESLALQRELGNEEGIARALDGLGFAAWLEEDHERAWTLCTEALSLYRGLEDAEGIAWSLVNLGAVAQHRGELERATQLLKESLALSREAGYREGVAWSLNELGVVAHRRGDLGRAEALLEESLGVHHDLGDRWRIASVLEALAGTACAQGEFERAARLFGAAEALREAIGTPVPLCERPDRDRNVAAASTRLDDAVWAEGRAMSVGEAVGYALAERSGAPQANAPAEAQPAVLTRRQAEIATLIARGLTSRQIAGELSISEHTVNTHVARILSRLDLRSRTQLVAWITERQPPNPG
jgi:predicted ATPase/DNA-binding SARP family transcriptional activator/DNA-binding CsgD family transcriptional regulator